MSTIPRLTTDRLVLRSLAMNDAPTIQELAGAYPVAAHIVKSLTLTRTGQRRNGFQDRRNIMKKGKG